MPYSKDPATYDVAYMKLIEASTLGALTQVEIPFNNLRSARSFVLRWNAFKGALTASGQHGLRQEAARLHLSASGDASQGTVLVEHYTVRHNGAALFLQGLIDKKLIENPSQPVAEQPGSNNASGANDKPFAYANPNAQEELLKRMGIGTGESLRPAQQSTGESE